MDWLDSFDTVHAQVEREIDNSWLLSVEVDEEESNFFHSDSHNQRRVVHISTNMPQVVQQSRLQWHWVSKQNS